jgi:hypothetical protein
MTAEPDAALRRPADCRQEPTWTLIGRTKEVQKGWIWIIENTPADARRWYDYLSTTPDTRYPGRVFPLKYTQYEGAWECEVNKGSRLFYTLDPDGRRVLVYYAGKHTKTVPIPPG